MKLLTIPFAATLIFPALAQEPPKERVVPANPQVSRAQADLHAISAAVQTYRLNCGHYPTPAQGLQALVEKPTTAPIPKRWTTLMTKVPLDPWGKPYVLVTRKRAKDNEEEHFIFSNGPDPATAKDDIELVLKPSFQGSDSAESEGRPEK
jgi:type II secretion system protein G